MGIHYNGRVNVTVSGKACQQWDSETPHFHPITSLFRPYLEGHNYCRNPEGRGKRPWCYTIDPSVRWEYCNIPHCSPLLTNTHDENDFTVTGIIVGISILIVIVLVLITIIVISQRITKMKQNKYPLHRTDSDKFEDMCVDNECYDPTRMTVDKLPNFARENVTYISDIGQGNFGVVMKGKAVSIIPGELSTLVAIKVLKGDSSQNAKNDFIKEALLMNQLNHPNILKLLGVCFDKEPLCLIFKYMDLGDLNKYLRNIKTKSSISLTVQQLVNMCVNIAAGLEYLAVRHFVHRDLATRNCLIDEKFVVKIADFGLSKDVYNKDYYKLDEKAAVPIRWMPPEAILYCKFSTQSDIWSFGIVLWEIFSSGIQPYCALSNEEVVEHVTKGNILQCPNDCPKKLYHLMVRCWANEPNKRPTASKVHSYLLNWSPDEDIVTQVAQPIVVKSSVVSSPGDVSLSLNKIAM